MRGWTGQWRTYRRSTSCIRTHTRTLCEYSQYRNRPSHSQPAAAYIHLPFCKRRCLYCDFPVTVVGKQTESPASQDRVKAYVDLLCKEVEATAKVNDKPLDTVFFGGGTPSLVPPNQLSRILAVLRKRFQVHEDAEISMEADPGTFDAQKLREYMDLGVTRFSIGIQAFQRELLEACGRSHGLEDVREAVEAVKEAGVPSWSLDLMCGLPHLSMPLWQSSLQEAIAACPHHISVYDLQVEDGTPFARRYTPGEGPLPSDEEAAEMYRTASSTLREAGYEHYEISNYAKPGHRSRHNQVYWAGTEAYYGFGMGAASYLRTRRFSRPKKMKEYETWLADFASSGGGLPDGPEAPEQAMVEQLLDAVMLRLRLSDGLDLDWLSQQFGRSAVEMVLEGLEPHFPRGLAVRIPPGAHPGDRLGRVRLTDPEGFLLSNDVISDVFALCPSNVGHDQHNQARAPDAVPVQ
eukprot:jgi/Botrbrau1/18241/Bobra.53_1s0095.1